MKKALVLILNLLALSVFAQADLLKRETPVKAALNAVKTAKPGSVIEVKVDIEIQKDWHLFSEQPEVPGIVPTQIILEPSDLFTVEKITFPKPVPEYSEVFKKTLTFYEGQITIPVQIKIKDGVKGPVPLKGVLRYQSCSNALCLPPSKISLSHTVDVNG